MVELDLEAFVSHVVDSKMLFRLSRLIRTFPALGLGLCSGNCCIFGLFDDRFGIFVAAGCNGQCHAGSKQCSQ